MECSVIRRSCRCLNKYPRSISTSIVLALEKVRKCISSAINAFQCLWHNRKHTPTHIITHTNAACSLFLFAAYNGPFFSLSLSNYELFCPFVISNTVMKWDIGDENNDRDDMIIFFFFRSLAIEGKHKPIEKKYMKGCHRLTK